MDSSSIGNGVHPNFLGSATSGKARAEPLDVEMAEVLPQVTETTNKSGRAVEELQASQKSSEQTQTRGSVLHRSPGNRHDAPTVTPSEPHVSDDDACTRIYEDMSQARTTAVSLPSQELNSGDHELIEYHEGINPITILSEALGKKRPNRLTRLLISKQGAKTAYSPQQPTPGFDSLDDEFLQKKGAFNCPPRQICDELLALYFSCIYPYAPILNRFTFLQDYTTGTHSIFLLQSILANVVPYAPMELLNQMGYNERLLAQKDFFSRAVLLYDFGHEKSQLHLLQGSIMLSSLSFSYSMDKDFRYWLSNACRISTRMGLHRAYVADGMDPRSKRLFRRIWWVLYNRDILLSTSGLDNLRRFNDRCCDTQPLTLDDWDEESDIPETFRGILTPTSIYQKLFLLESSKLSVISGLFLDFKMPGASPTTAQIDALSDRITSWRTEMPLSMQIGSLREWTSDNILVLVLQALGFRLEAILHRSAKQHYRSQSDSSLMHRAAQRQERAIFELSTIIQRASVHEVLHLCPLSFMTCASTILAMRIETALDPTVTKHKRLATKTQIFAELEYLREASEFWSSLVWSLRMFEAVVARSGLGLTAESPADTTTDDYEDPSTIFSASNQNLDAQCDMGRNGNAHGNNNNNNNNNEKINNDNGDNNKTDDNIVRPTASMGTWDTSTYDNYVGDGSGPEFAITDEAFGLLPLSDDYNWLQNILSPRWR